MPAHPRPDSRPVSEFLARTALAPRQAHKALTLWPLVLQPDAPDPAGPGFVALADALRAGTASVGEVAGGAQVPHVRVTNRGREAVLVLFGEELAGAMQNRIANASFLVPGESQLNIDVSCTEAGRWARRSSGFAAGLGLVSSAMRRKMSRKVAQARAAGLSFDADQGEVWQGVANRIAFSAAYSPTGAYEDYARSRGSDLHEIRAAFRPLARQVGFVAAIGDEVVGLEAIGWPGVFASCFERLLSGYAIDAVDHAFVRELEEQGEREARRVARFDAPEAFLAALADAPCHSGPSLGLGSDLRIEGGGVAGCALIEGAVVHLTAFPEEGA